MTYATRMPPTSPQPAALPPSPIEAPARRSRQRKDWLGYLFLLPYLLLFTMFLLLPLAFGLGISFTDYDMKTQEPARFVGMTNYREAVSDAYFIKSLWATVRFVAMASPLTVALALVLALAISSVSERRQHVYRLAIFVPTMITISVAGILWRWFYNPEFGVFNGLLSRFDYKVYWLTDMNLAMKSIVLMTLWWTVGGPVIVLLAGIKQIPDVYYEAAAIDGATGWKRTWHITLPLLKPVLLFVIVLNIIGAFQIFGQTFIITRGGPERSTLVLMQYIYEASFMNYRLGYGAAMSWILFLLIAAFSIVQFRLMREK